MRFNESVIPHYELQRVPLEELKKMVKISPDHLKEKSSWFIIKGQLCYFKEREETRMFTEIFLEEYGNILGFDMAKYQLGYISEREVGGKKGKNKLGLISPNYQDPNYNYYLASDLLDNHISNLSHYGNYSLSGLMNYLMNEFEGVEGVEQTLQDTANLYVLDCFTKQIDRNPKNICYEVLAEENPGNKKYWGLHSRKVQKIRLATVFDSEKSLGIVKTPSGYRLTDSTMTWESACPYSMDDKMYEGYGVDPRMLQIFLEYEKLARPLIERLAYDDEFRKVIEMFSAPNSRMFIDQSLKKHLLAIFYGRQEEFKRLLSL